MATFNLDLITKDGIIMTNFNYMEIYQGEPLTGRMYHKKEDGTYATQNEIQAYTLEALVKDSKGIVKKTWNTFTYGTDTGTTKGYAEFKIKGSETKELASGIYTFEIAKVENAQDGDRAIGILTDILTIKQCNIRGGIPQ